YMRCLNGGLLVNYHYTRFGEVLLFLSLKPLDTQGLRIMKFIQKGEIKYVAANFWTDLGSSFRIIN
ncbi:hypothetical protein HV436_08025, partial [Bacillus sporothermodurans]|nr:hypothetical protein [Heyndrickxia sporothermodurans]